MSKLGSIIVIGQDRYSLSVPKAGQIPCDLCSFYVGQRCVKQQCTDIECTEILMGYWEKLPTTDVLCIDE